MPGPKRKVTINGEELPYTLTVPCSETCLPVYLLSSSSPGEKRELPRWPGGPGALEAQSLLLGTFWKPAYCFSPFAAHQKRRPVVEQDHLTQSFRTRGPFVATYHSPPMFIRNKVNILVSICLTSQPYFSAGSELTWARASLFTHITRWGGQVGKAKKL